MTEYMKYRSNKSEHNTQPFHIFLQLILDNTLVC